MKPLLLIVFAAACVLPVVLADESSSVSKKPDSNKELQERIEKLEKRVAALEKANGHDVSSIQSGSRTFSK
jgi:hypothetical protein